MDTKKLPTLHDRLRDEYKALLAEHIIDYPATYGNAMTDITNNFFVHDLKYSTFEALNCMGITQVTSAWGMFRGFEENNELNII